MTDLQCGLCLSCGVPFLPDVERIEFFNHEGVLSVVFLNTEFSRNHDIITSYNTPKFSSSVDQAHIFHRSHHFEALQYMCLRHANDDDVGGGHAHPVNGNRIPDNRSEALLYFHAPTSAGNRQPKAATWVRPPAADRLNMRSLFRFITTTANLPHTRTPTQNLGQTYAMCTGCNALMTEIAGFRYMLGFGVAGRRNVHGGIIQGHPIREYAADPRGRTIENAYGHWRYTRVPAVGNVVHRPDQTTQDSTAPHVAYYLHMCLPFQAAPNLNPFRVVHGGVRRQRARTMFLEQCWLILEIAALATHLEEGRVMTGTRRSHGMHQFYGVLEIYVSFFLWRLIQFRYGRFLGRHDMNFVQWHQRYYCDAINCDFLFRRNERRVLIGQRMYGRTTQPGGALVEQICKRLMRHFNTKLRPLILLVARQPNIPPEISDYFVHPAVLRELRALTRRVRALLFLCRLLPGTSRYSCAVSCLTLYLVHPAVLRALTRRVRALLPVIHAPFLAWHVSFLPDTRLARS